MYCKVIQISLGQAECRFKIHQEIFLRLKPGIYYPAQTAIANADLADHFVIQTVKQGVEIGQNFNISTIDSYWDPAYVVFEGTRQGLYVQNSTAYFDLYIYRDAYTPILSECPANQFGTSQFTLKGISSLYNIHDGDWALYAGIEFGNSEF